MIVINTRTNEAFYNVTTVQAARMLGVNRNTIARWRDQKEKVNKETYNHFHIYFKTTQHVSKPRGYNVANSAVKCYKSTSSDVV